MSGSPLMILPERLLLFRFPKARLWPMCCLNPEFDRNFRVANGGLCGKCLVEIVDGEAGTANPAERAVLDRPKPAPGYRLACRLYPQGPLTIRIAPEARLSTIAPFDREPPPGNRRRPTHEKVRSHRPRGFDGRSPIGPGRAAGGVRHCPSRPFPLRFCPSWPVWMRRGRNGDGCALRRPAHSGRRAGRHIGTGIGAAVDLGTTTVVVEIIDLSDGRTMAASAGLNGQARFGADVVSRITAAHFDPEKLSGLRDAARRTINGLLAGAFHEAGIRPPDCYEIVVAGNTVMSHLFSACPWRPWPRPRFGPFSPPSSRSRLRPAAWT